MLGSADLFHAAPVGAGIFPAAESQGLGVHMNVTARRVGVMAGAIGLGAILLSTSTVASVRLGPSEPNVNLRLSLTALRAGVDAPPGVWAVPAAYVTSRSLQALEQALPSLRGAVNGGAPVAIVPVTVGAGAETLIATDAATVTDLLLALGVRLAPTDVVKPSPDASLADARAVVVTRVRRVVRTVVETIPFETDIRYTPTMKLGRIQVLRAGVTGRQTRTYRITYRNGREVARTVLSEGPVTSPKTQVERYGTYPVPLPPTQRTQFGDATWYPNCREHGLHAAHTSLPFGTRVTVTNLDNSETVTVVINDRGPYGSGRIIDLCPEAFAVIAPLGQGVAHVKITW